MHLTKRAIDAMRYEGTGNGRQVTWDDEIPGLGCRIFPSGKKSFVLSYRINGRQRLMTLGAYGVLTLQQARGVARAALAKVEAGDDPLAERQAARQGETMADLAATYLERHASLKKTGATDARRLERHILPAWRTRKAHDITRADVASLHSRIGMNCPYEANRTLSLLGKMFELARRWGFVPEAHPNPARDIDRFKEEKRDRYVTAAELPKLAKAINEETNEAARNALWLYLLTGCRKSEILAAQWSWIDWDRAELRLPDTKAGRIHYVPLSAPAMTLLRGIPRIDGNPHILPGAKPGAHLVNIALPWNRVRQAAGVADVRLHDLRRTVGSWLAQAGNSLHLIGRILNHSNPATTAVYARFGQDSVRAAMEQHGIRLMGAAGLAPEADVIDIKDKRTMRDR
jgi:integrase